jgi:DNA-directed RNA polymerase II subunit RPB2
VWLSPFIDIAHIRAGIVCLSTVPVMLLFRALGFVHDRQILSHIVYDFQDAEMLERLRCVCVGVGWGALFSFLLFDFMVGCFWCVFRPSMDEARPLQTADAALNYLGSRGGMMERTALNQRIKYAEELLQKDVLPHVSLEASQAAKTKKGFFIGYMTHRLLMCSLGRADEDDRCAVCVDVTTCACFIWLCACRDHFANKRLDMSGQLIGGLFRQLFYRVTKEMRAALQRVRVLLCFLPVYPLRPVTM